MRVRSSAAGVSVAEPIQFIFISTTKQDGETIQPRNLVVAGQQPGNGHRKLHCGGHTAYFTNTVTEIVAGDNAMLEHVKFQDEATPRFIWQRLRQLGRRAT